MARREKELRCFCRTAPLLATFGIDNEGTLFVHVKVWKQKRIFGELVCMGGTVKVRCRDCLRWHRIIFAQDRVRLRESTAPDADTIRA